MAAHHATFATKQPDLNWENPEVRQAVHAMMRRHRPRLCLAGSAVQCGGDGFDLVNFPSGQIAGSPTMAEREEISRVPHAGPAHPPGDRPLARVRRGL
jgi:oligo-1,6-glucosidase